MHRGYSSHKGDSPFCVTEKNADLFGTFAFSSYLCHVNITKSMEQKTDIRWIQRYMNYHKACMRLLEVTEADRYIQKYTESCL